MNEPFPVPSMAHAALLLVKVGFALVIVATVAMHISPAWHALKARRAARRLAYAQRLQRARNLSAYSKR